MSMRIVARALLLATAIAAAPSATSSLSAQASQAPGSDLQAPSAASQASGSRLQAPQRQKSEARSQKPYTPPRTPWGDPDLQGNYTNVYENGTPLERPDQFAGRRLDDVKGEELAAIKRATQERTINNFQGPIHAPDHWWQDALFLEKGSQAWFVTDPTDGKIPPVTPDAQKRIDTARSARAASGRGPADAAEDRSLYDRCITRGYPGSMMPAIYGNSYRIVQGQGYVAILYEMIHETRVIPIETQSRPHVGKKLHMDMGDARGHWEGDTLVVETTNFNPRSVYRNANPDALRITERFTRLSAEKVRWSVTIDDPSTWTRPWTFAMPLTANESEPLLAYECHEGNYGLRNILSAARADEKNGIQAPAGRRAAAPGDAAAPAEQTER
jgi:hypothetical protein